MKKKKGITPLNDKGQPHGLWEMYWVNGKLMWKCFYHNAKEIGYNECYDWYDCHYTDKLEEKKYYI